MADTHRRQNIFQVLSYYYHFRYAFLYLLICLEIRPITSCKGVTQSNETSSVPNYRLKDYVLVERREESIFECIKACDKHGTCRSVNYKLSGLVCQLNKADAHTAPQSYFPAKGYVYGDNPWLKITLVRPSEERKFQNSMMSESLTMRGETVAIDKSQRLLQTIQIIETCTVKQFQPFFIFPCSTHTLY